MRVGVGHRIAAVAEFDVGLDDLAADDSPVLPHRVPALAALSAGFDQSVVFEHRFEAVVGLAAQRCPGGVPGDQGETHRADGLAGDIVYALAEDRDGVLWIGTNKGLSRFDGSGWQTYGRHEGLGNLDVYAVEITADGDIWVGTKEAVVRLAYENTGETQ